MTSPAPDPQPEVRTLRVRVTNWELMKIMDGEELTLPADDLGVPVRIALFEHPSDLIAAHQAGRLVDAPGGRMAGLNRAQAAALIAPPGHDLHQTRDVLADRLDPHRWSDRNT
jgi:hypothetical protein